MTKKEAIVLISYTVLMTALAIYLAWYGYVPIGY